MGSKTTPEWSIRHVKRISLINSRSFGVVMQVEHGGAAIAASTAGPSNLAEKKTSAAA
jgi:hypothetical protein